MPASVYPAAPQTARRDLAIGLVVSLMIFVGAPVLSTWLKSGPPKPPPKDVIPHIEMVMPKIEPDEEPRHAEVVDLMERLRRSLAQGGRTPGGPPHAATAKRTSRKATPKKRARRAA